MDQTSTADPGLVANVEAFVTIFGHFDLHDAELRAVPELAHMRILQRGNRLSITPVEPAEWQCIVDRL